MKRLIEKEKLYNASEVAKIFGVEHMTVRRWIKKLNLNVQKVGSEWKFTEWIDVNKVDKKLEIVEKFRFKINRRKKIDSRMRTLWIVESLFGTCRFRCGKMNGV